jgi:hypothetical protein
MESVWRSFVALFLEHPANHDGILKRAEFAVDDEVTCVAGVAGTTRVLWGTPPRTTPGR